MSNSRSSRIFALLTISTLLMLGEGCAHRRQTYYGSDIGPSQGVHVRAPFVDVHVNKRFSNDNEPRLSRNDQDDDDDDRDDD